MSATAMLTNRSQLTVGHGSGPARVYTLTGDATATDNSLRFKYIHPRTDEEEWRCIQLNSVERAQELSERIQNLRN